jgi:hypothetical protein
MIVTAAATARSECCSQTARKEKKMITIRGIGNSAAEANTQTLKNRFTFLIFLNTF